KNRKHGRQTEIVALRRTGETETAQFESIEVDLDSKESKDWCLDRQYHCAIPMDDGRILVFGGRKSPLKPCETILLLRFQKSGNGLKAVVDVLKLSGLSEAIPRWRSAGCRVTDDTVFISGGLTVGSNCSTVLNDSYLIRVKEENEMKAELTRIADLPL